MSASFPLTVKHGELPHCGWKQNRGPARWNVSAMHLALVFILLAAPCIFAQTSCLQDDQERISITAIRNAMAVPNVAAFECCEWTRISCSVSDRGRIEQLTIAMSPGLFPDGRIPRQVCSFKRLRSLELVMHDPSQTWNDVMPSCLNELVEIEELKVVGSSAAFEVPEMTRLRKLELHQVNLTGASLQSIFSNFTELQELSIVTDGLFTTIPASLCSLTNLMALQLSSHFTGEIPQCLPLLSRLQHLRLSDNSLVGTVPYLGNFSQLRTLVLTGNQMHGPIPDSICNISATISFLDLSRNYFSSPLPECVAEIQNIYLHSNRLTGQLPRTLFARNVSGMIELSKNQFTGSLPEIIDAARPTGVILSDNFLSGTISSQRWHSFCRYLEILDLSSNQFTGIIPESIGNCTLLKQLNIHNNAFHGEIPSTIGALPQLAQFTCRNNRLTGVLPSRLGNCSYLTVLDVANNSLSGELGEWIYKLKFLSVLNLGSNRFVGSIPNGLGNFSLQLMAINLSNNRFSSTLPKQLSFTFVPLSYTGELAYYILSLRFYAIIREMNLRLYNTIHFSEAYLDISGNNLQGSLPESLGNFSRLGYIDLSRNQLVGSIPASLGSLQHLQSLDLSNNRLSGSIPRELAGIPQLAHFNVSYNNFSGPLPRGGQFNTFAEDSYIHNPELCGFPLRSCNSTEKQTFTTMEEDQARHTHLTEAVALVSTFLFTMVLLVCLLYLLCSWRGDKKTRRSVSIVEGELWNATQGFKDDNIIGKGGCSTIYRGVTRNNQAIAVKVFQLSEPTAEQQFITEYNTLRDLRHRNIIKMIDWCFESQLKALVLKFMENGSLERQLHDLHGSNLPWKTRINIVQGLASALSYLHEDAGGPGPVIHRDVKPANILLDQEMEAHLGDFGIARTLCPETSKHWETKFEGSIGYVAPEYCSDGSMTTAADVYSYGVVILEILTRIRPTSITLNETSLRHLVESHLTEGRLEKVLDPVLRRDSIEELVIDAVARIGLLCTHPIAAARPRMGEVVTFLRMCTSKHASPSL